MRHFEEAMRIEPDYCECRYWMGRTFLDLGDALMGTQNLREAVSCKWVTTEVRSSPPSKRPFGIATLGPSG